MLVVLVEITKRTSRSSRLVSYLLFKVTQKVLSLQPISIFANVKTILSEQINRSEHKKGALYHQYDWNFHKMIGYMLDCSVKDDKELDACLEHELSCEFYTSTKRIANLL